MKKLRCVLYSDLTQKWPNSNWGDAKNVERLLTLTQYSIEDQKVYLTAYVHHFQFYRPKHFLDGPNCKTILSGKSYVLFPEKSYFKIQNINWWDGRWDWMKQQERGEKGQGGVVLHRRLRQSPPQPLRVILNFVYWIGWKTKAAHGGWLWVIFGEG